MKYLLTAAYIFAATFVSAQEASQESNPDGYVDSNRWVMVWNDEFDYENSKLTKRWVSDDGRYKPQIASVRYRDNVVVEDGVVKLLSKRVYDNPNVDWTTGNIWTKSTFKYGYFECRYKYAEAHTINNAFWLMPAPETEIPEGGVKFEIDVNEGHYPNLLYLDLHDWTNYTIVDGKKKFPRDQRCYIYGAEPMVDISLTESIKCSKLRFSSTHKTAFHIKEFMAFTSSADTYNYVMDRDVSITASDETKSKVKNIADGNNNTSWIAPLDGDKWFEIDFGKECEIGAIQFINGYKSPKENHWIGMVSDYKIEAWIDNQWIVVEKWDVRDSTNFASTYHTYGLEWTRDELIYYFDGVEIRREENTVCHNHANVYLTTAVLRYLGEIPDDVDGSQMVVDYVRIYREK
ncbi:MAG: family 16 glycosylhydrolase [Rikenellaceae bacterium]